MQLAASTFSSKDVQAIDLTDGKRQLVAVSGRGAQSMQGLAHWDSPFSKLDVVLGCGG